MTDTRLEVWDRPGTAGFASRIETLDSIVDSSRLQPVNGIGEGKVSVPDTFTEVDKVLTVDPVTPANSVRSLIRVYLDGDVSGVSTPYREWLPDAAIPPSEAESGRYEITGLGIESIVRDAVVEPWDWDGEPDFASNWPDWIYGGRDLIAPLEVVFKPHIYHVWIVPTGGAISGTLDIGVSKDGSAFEDATVAWNAAAAGGAGSVETELEALSYGLDVEVTGFGTEANPWEISILSPPGFYVVVQSTGALVNAVARGSLKQLGKLLPVGWEPSRLDNTSVPHGFLADFRASLGTGSDPPLPAGCSAWIVFDGTEPLTPGVQTIPQKVIPGGIYQLPDDMILHAQGAGGVFRVVIRDLDENILFDINGNPAFEELTLVANTDTPITGIADVMIPLGVSQIIIRIGHIGTGDPPPLFIACPSFIEGFEAATVGYIVRKFYEDWTVDHIADTFPLDYWLHGDGGHYLDLDFSDTLDSAGNAWPRDEKITVRAGSRFDKVLGLIVGLGYEWRVIPAPVDGYWLLQIFTAPTLGTVYPGPTPTIRGGRDIIRRAIRRWLPKTGVMVQGADQFFSHAADTGAQATLGISTDYQPRPDYEPEATIVAAPVAVENAIRRTRSLVVNVADVQEPLFPIPGRTYVSGDTLRVIDPPEIVDDPERVWSILYTRTEQGIVWEIQLGNESFASTGGGGGGAAGAGAGGGVDPAVAEPLRWLLDKEELNRQRPPPPPDRPPEPGCCPTCPAIVEGVAPAGVVGTTTTLDWIIDNDPDGITAETVSGGLKLVQSGLYSVHILLIWRFNSTIAGWANWLTEAFCSDNDAGNSSITVMSAMSSAATMEISATHFFWAHTAEAGETIGAYFMLVAEQSAGLVNTATGVITAARMTVIRHGEGCARIGGEG